MDPNDFYTRPASGPGRRPNLTTVTGLTAEEAAGQMVSGVHQAQNPALRQTLASQSLVEMGTRPAEPARATLLPEHAETLHIVAGAAFQLPPTHIMVMDEDGSGVTAAQVAMACARAVAVAAPAGWGATPPASVPDSLAPAEKVASPAVQQTAPPENDDPSKPAPLATLVGDVRARLSSATQVTLGPGDLAHGKVSVEAAEAALREKGLTVHQINPGVLLVTPAQDAPPEQGTDNQPLAGSGTGDEEQDAGKGKEEIPPIPPTQCPYCTVDPFGSVMGRNAHIRAKHPDTPVPAAHAPAA